MSAIKSLDNLTHARLKEVLRYDQETGVFTWKARVSIRVRAGDQAGSIGRKGRRHIRVDGVLYAASRLAYFYVTGAMPIAQVDHIDTDPTNDRFVNLRDVSQPLNCENHRKAYANSKTGVLGVVRVPSGRFAAQIRKDRRSIYIGTFDTTDAAHGAYVAAKRQLHEGCTL